MVLEPLSAFSLACNVIQIVEVGCKVLSGAADYRKSTDGSLTEQRELREISRTLNNLSTSLQSFLSDPSRSATKSAEVARLIEANEECLRLSKDFIDLLDQLKVKDRHSTLDSIRASIKARWYKDRMNAMQQALSEARDNLNIAFLLYMHSQHTIVNSQLREQISTSTAETEQNILDAVSSSTDSIQDEVRKLAEQLKETYLDSPEQSANGFLSTHQNVLEEILAQIKIVSAAQSQAQSATVDDRVQLAERRILDSLHFSQMNDRREQVNVAYSSTYQWVLRPLAEDVRTWDCFVTWIDASTNKYNLYWIHGKPGSGKSTIMKYLDDNLDLEDHMSTWAEGKPVIRARCFFWSSGNTLQKSLQGLYRSLLFQLMEIYPSLMPKVVPQRRWRAAQFSDVSLSVEWTSSELRNMLTELVRYLQSEVKILLLIDGLDEFEGSDEDQDDLVDYIRNLSRVKNIKICCSSRPLNVFHDAFIDCPQLRLEDLTSSDIETYTTSCLRRSQRWSYFKQHYPAETANLTSEIIRRAAGVFLWVRLVVSDLLRGLRDGDGFDELKRKLQLVPTDLNGYFSQIINSIRPDHQREASVLLQLMLHNETEFLTLHPLRLADALFINEEDEAFAASTRFNFASLNLRDRDSLQFLVDSTLRKVNSRCMGLLEVTAGGSKPYKNQRDTDLDLYVESALTSAVRGEGGNTIDPIRSLVDLKIDFLHRSLRDYLLTPEMQAFLHRHTEGLWDARMYLCSARLVQVVGLVQIQQGYQFAAGLASYLLSALSVNHNSHITAIMTDLIQPAINEIAIRPIDKNVQWYIRPSLESWSFENSTFVTLAIDFNLTAYVLPRLTSEVIRGKTGRPILDYILRPRFTNDATLHVNNRWPNIQILKTVLSLGADPNQTCGGGATSVWGLFLCFLRDGEWWSVTSRDRIEDNDEIQQSAYYQALELMVEAGAALTLPMSHIVSSGLYQRYGDSYDRIYDKTTEHDLLSRWPPTIKPLNPQVDKHEFALSDLLEVISEDFDFSFDILIQKVKSKELLQLSPQHIDDMIVENTF